MVEANFTYSGGELEVFAHAVNWRAYWRTQVAQYLGRRVLEVGAGIGNVTRALCSDRVERWVALEPDGGMAEHLARDARAGRLPPSCEVHAGTIAHLGPNDAFDTILYIDVLEHIEDDRAELERAARRLAPGGHLVVLAPAHQPLYTAFDAAIGHHRRYARRDLVSLTPPRTALVRSRYLDSVGLLASLANRILLRSSSPTVAQIRAWDRVLVRCSRVLDPLLAFRVGKSVLAVWREV